MIGYLHLHAKSSSLQWQAKSMAWFELLPNCITVSKSTGLQIHTMYLNVANVVCSTIFGINPWQIAVTEVSRTNIIRHDLFSFKAKFCHFFWKNTWNYQLLIIVCLKEGHFCTLVAEALQCSGCFITWVGAHFLAAELDYTNQFDTLSMVSSFLWHSSEWASWFCCFLQYMSWFEVLAWSM